MDKFTSSQHNILSKQILELLLTPSESNRPHPQNYPTNTINPKIVDYSMELLTFIRHKSSKLDPETLK